MNNTGQTEAVSLPEWLHARGYDLYEYTPTQFDIFGKPLPYIKYGVYTRTRLIKNRQFVFCANSPEEVYRGVNQILQIRQNIENCRKGIRR